MLKTMTSYGPSLTSTGQTTGVKKPKWLFPAAQKLISVVGGVSSADRQAVAGAAEDFVRAACVAAELTSMSHLRQSTDQGGSI
eukprot:SAG31_NODE_17397_length_672_cov_1.020942_1_plen_82_part_10